MKRTFLFLDSFFSRIKTKKKEKGKKRSNVKFVFFFPNGSCQFALFFVAAARFFGRKGGELRRVMIYVITFSWKTKFIIFPCFLEWNHITKSGERSQMHDKTFFFLWLLVEKLLVRFCEKQKKLFRFPLAINSITFMCFNVLLNNWYYVVKWSALLLSLLLVSCFEASNRYFLG